MGVGSLLPLCGAQGVNIRLQAFDPLSHLVSPKTHFQSFSFLSPGYAAVHSPRFSFADLHQRHSSAPDSTEKTTLHFSEGKNKLCPHNSDPLEEQAEAHSTYDLSG